MRDAGEARDAAIEARYRAASNEMPSAAADAAILAPTPQAANDASWRKRLRAPLALAACAVLTVGIVTRIGVENPTGVTASAPVSERIERPTETASSASTPLPPVAPANAPSTTAQAPGARVAGHDVKRRSRKRRRGQCCGRRDEQARGASAPFNLTRSGVVTRALARLRYRIAPRRAACSGGCEPRALAGALSGAEHSCQCAWAAGVSGRQQIRRLQMAVGATMRFGAWCMACGSCKKLRAKSWGGIQPWA